VVDNVCVDVRAGPECGKEREYVEQINERLMNWASILEPVTLEQALTTATLPFIHPHLALMSDAHLGRGRRSGR
jgi:tRNA-splicing ligase RtcB